MSLVGFFRVLSVGLSGKGEAAGDDGGADHRRWEMEREQIAGSEERKIKGWCVGLVTGGFDKERRGGRSWVGFYDSEK